MRQRKAHRANLRDSSPPVLDESDQWPPDRLAGPQQFRLSSTPVLAHHVLSQPPTKMYRASLMGPRSGHADADSASAPYIPPNATPLTDLSAYCYQPQLPEA